MYRSLQKIYKSFFTCNTGLRRSSSARMRWGHWNTNIVTITIILIILNTCRRTDWRTRRQAFRSDCSCCRSSAAEDRNTPYCLEKISLIEFQSVDHFAGKYWMWIRDVLLFSLTYLSFLVWVGNNLLRSFRAIDGESVTYQIFSHWSLLRQWRGQATR